MTKIDPPMHASKQREKTQNHRSGKFYHRGCNINMWSCHAKYIVTILIKCFNRAGYELPRFILSILFSLLAQGWSSQLLTPCWARAACGLRIIVIFSQTIEARDRWLGHHWSGLYTYCTLWSGGQTFILCFTFVEISHSDKMIQCTCQDSMNSSPKMLITQYFFLCSCISIHKEKQSLLFIFRDH